MSTLLEKYKDLYSQLEYVKRLTKHNALILAYERNNGININDSKYDEMVEQILTDNNKEIVEYYHKKHVLDDLYRRDLYTEFNVLNNNKADRCYIIARELVDDEDEYKTYDVFSKIVELIK